MKKALTLTLALLLTACGLVQPAAQQEQPTPIVQTVVVVATAQATQPAPPTSISLPTQGPTNTAAPEASPTAVAPTAAPPTAVPPTSGSSSSASTSDLTPVHVDNILAKGIFSDITISSDRLTLNCYPREVEITLKALHPDVTRAEMYYRMVEVPSYFRYSDWYPLGNLDTDGSGNFFKTVEGVDLSPDWRSLDQAVIEFQFVGVNKGGGVVGRTEKLEKLVMYYKECP